MSYELKEYLNAINFTKKNLMESDDELWKKKYPAFIVNKLLSAFSDTIMLVNEMNRNHFIDKDMQFQFLLNSIRTKKRYSPFLRASKLKEYLNAINHTKKNVMDSEDTMWVKKYPAFIVNKVLSGFSDTIMLVNEMNRNHFLDKDMQFQFLLNSIRSKKRYSPFLRASKIKDIECVKEYYGYNNEKAKTALDLLTKQELKLIKEKLYKGGKK